MKHEHVSIWKGAFLAATIAGFGVDPSSIYERDLRPRKRVCLRPYAQPCDCGANDWELGAERIRCRSCGAVWERSGGAWAHRGGGL